MPLPQRKQLERALAIVGVVAVGIALTEGLSRGVLHVLDAADVSRDFKRKVGSLATLLMQFCLVAPILWIVKRWSVSHRSLGLARPLSWLQSLGVTLAAYFGYLMLAGAYLIAIGIDVNNRPEHDAIKILRENRSVWVIGPLVVAAVFIAPIIEEFVFRGFLMRQLQTTMPAALAIIISSIIFGSVHIGVIPLELVPPYVGLGAVLGIVAFAAKSIRPAMVLHAAQNGLSTGVALGSLRYSVLLISSAVGVQVVMFLLLEWRRPTLVNSGDERPHHESPGRLG